MRISAESNLRRPVFWIIAGAILAVLLALVLLPYYRWRHPRELDETYGRIDGRHWHSINGTWVFSQMLRQARHRVERTNRLDSTIKNRADCVVWFTSIRHPPPKPVVDWFETWLKAQPGRTLIYVGRDFEAGPLYCRKIAQRSPEGMSGIDQQRLAAREAATENRLRDLLTKPAECAWFKVEPLDKVERPRELKLHPDWQMPIDDRQLELEFRTLMTPAKDAEPLVQAGRHVLVSRLKRDQSQILLVHNASFLVNMMLVNKEHRKLALRLIQAIEESGSPGAKRIVFLELTPGALLLMSPFSQPKASDPYGFLTVYPLSWILYHLLAVGVLLVLWRFPRLGPGVETDIVRRTSFDAHLEAMARWLKKSRNRQFAEETLARWQRVVQGPRGGISLSPVRPSRKSSLLRRF